MSNAAKNKGNSWERECAKILTNTFGVHFERNKNGSGAFVGGKNVKRKSYLSETQILSFMADILVPTGYESLCIECKFYKEFPFHHFLINKPIPLLDSWIEQQLDVVDDSNFWFIAFKINHCGSYIVIPKDLCDFIDDKLGNHSLYYHNNREYIVADFETFIQIYKAEITKKSHQ